MEEDEKIEELLPEAEFKGEDLRAVYDELGYSGYEGINLWLHSHGIVIKDPCKIIVDIMKSYGTYFTSEFYIQPGQK